METYLITSGFAFIGALIVNSFIEWTVHRFIMHRLNRLIPYGYEHTTSHHAAFGAGETYHVQNEEMMEKGTAFTWREYILFPVFCTGLYLPVELLTGIPVYASSLLAVLVGLLAFDLLHYGFHVPANTWFQRTRVFQFLKRHHRIHHDNYEVNLNVTLPLADLCLGTLRRRG